MIKVTLTLALTLLLGNTAALAEASYLFSYKKNAIAPLLAKTVSKVDDQNYRIVLDTQKKVGGKALSAVMVKISLEAQLSKKLSLTAKVENPSTILLSYKGSEKAFLSRVSRTKISPRHSLKMDSTLADTGIRAKTGNKSVGDNQIQVKILKSSNTQISGLVLQVGKSYESQVKKGRKITIHGEGLSFKKGKKELLSPVFKGEKWFLH